MLPPMVPLWKRAPFLRLLIPLVSGILIQWYFPLPVKMFIIISCFCCFFYLLFGLLRDYYFFRYRWILGALVFLMTAVLGMMITHFKNISHRSDWLGIYNSDSTTVVAILTDKPVEREKSWKVQARVNTLMQNNSILSCEGRILIYFEKGDAGINELEGGSAIVFKKNLQPIRNSGNPGAFDYRRYCLFQGITHQVYLRKNEFVLHARQSDGLYRKWIQGIRGKIIRTLQIYIPGRSESAIAQALLIGYRNDLDADQLRSFANAGVMHVIAISGLHLGIVYGLLVFLLRPFKRKPGFKWICGLIILICLWLFALLTGAGPSVLRSAVMFSFIVIGESVQKKISVYHTLSASAFFLLCWNPFYLWDIGFQLSYAAVLSIVIFSKPISCWFYSRIWFLNSVWKLMAVTLAAQILTMPLTVYHFHQMSNLFLPANLIIVPLSALALYGEILLCLISPITVVANFLGKILGFILGTMNHYVALIDTIPFAVSNNFSISVFQSGLLFLFIATIGSWLMSRQKRMFILSLVLLMVMGMWRLGDRWSKRTQSKLVVYNIPGHRAIDFVQGLTYQFEGDSVIVTEPGLYNFYLRPARLSFGLKRTENIRGLKGNSPFYYFGNQAVLVLDSSWVFPNALEPIDKHVIILSGAASVSISQLHQIFNCRQYVFDASSPAWKIRQWKNECDSLHLRRHSVAEDGAFILDL